jgi:hypothetical protein
MSESETSNNEAADAVWGARACGAVIKRTPGQFYYLYRTGALDGAVTKLGPKTFVGSRKRLQALIPSKLK